MAIHRRSAEQIERIRHAGWIVHKVLERLGERLAPGVATEELDREAEQLCRRLGGQCLFKGVPGRGAAGPFPGNVCISLNEQVVHGIPSARTVREGDIVSVDFGARLAGWCGDAAETFVVGLVRPEVRRLVDVTRNALALAIRMCRPGQRWSHAARAIEEYVRAEGFSIVQDFVGHGIGMEMHEEPKVPNFVSRDMGDFVLAEGMVLAIEPMVNLGSAEVEGGPDGWTVVTRDRRPSAHFEHTVAVTAHGPDVLTDGHGIDESSLCPAQAGDAPAGR